MKLKIAQYKIQEEGSRINQQENVIKNTIYLGEKIGKIIWERSSSLTS